MLVLNKMFPSCFSVILMTKIMMIQTDNDGVSFVFVFLFLAKISTNMSDANNETAAVTKQQSPPQNGKERSKSTEEKEIPREPALVCKDINVSC